MSKHKSKQDRDRSKNSVRYLINRAVFSVGKIFRFEIEGPWVRENARLILVAIFVSLTVLGVILIIRST